MSRISLLLFSLITTLTACGVGSEMASNSAGNADPVTVATAGETADADFKSFANAPAVPAANANSAVRVSQTRPNRTSQIAPTKISLVKAEETYQADRKIIRNAELDLEAENPEDAQRRITSIAELRGGFVVESHQSLSEIKSTTRDIVTMTVRVPADKFNDTLADIRNVSSRTLLETIKGQDVTEEFIDIEAQLKAKKALEAQFMEIMRRAHTIGDALDVQSQLAEVRGDIERIEGRKRFLENQSAMSTIKVRLQTGKVIIAASSVGFDDRLAKSFAAGAEVAMGFVLGLITVIVAALPFALFVGLPVFVILRYFWRKQMRPQSVIDLAEEELKST